MSEDASSKLPVYITNSIGSLTRTHFVVGVVIGVGVVGGVICVVVVGVVVGVVVVGVVVSLRNGVRRHHKCMDTGPKTRVYTAFAFVANCCCTLTLTLTLTRLTRTTSS